MADRNVKIIILAASLTVGMMAYAPAQIKEGRQEPQAKVKGADNTATSQQRIKKSLNQPLPVEIENLINDARAAPAEFAADALIRIAQSSKVTSPKRKRALLDEAFRRAATAQNPVRREALAGSEVDTRSGYLSYAFDLKLDALSLRCRTIQAMLAIDKMRARELFSEISPKLPLPALTCEDALVYNVSEFYETLARVAQTTFSPEETKQDAHIYFVMRYVDAMSSPAQVTPIAKVITAVKPSQHQAAVLIQSFSEALKKISGDDRSFTSWMGRAPYDGGSLRGLLETSKQQNVPSSNLREAVRTYLTNNLHGERCADSADSKGQAMPAYVKYVNSDFLKANPISPEDITPAKLEGTVKTHSYWTSPHAQRISAEVKSLSFNETGAPLSVTDKETAVWQQSLMKFLGGLTEWNESQEESAADYFHQKSVVYLGLLKVAPDDFTRRNILNNFVIFLRDSSIQRDSPIEWLAYVNRLLDGARSSKSERSSILETLSKSNSANLKLYGNLERLLT